MPDIICPLPGVLTHERAREVFQQIRREMPGLQESAYRREAARRMGVDYDTYLAAWKKPGTASKAEKLIAKVPSAPKGIAPLPTREAPPLAPDGHKAYDSIFNSTFRTPYMKETERALDNYIHDDFIKYNKYLRGQEVPSEADSLRFHADIGNLRSWIRRSPTTMDATVYRGVREWSKLGLKPGEHFTDKTFVSTSPFEWSAKKFAWDAEDSAIMVISVPKGTPMGSVGKVIGKEFDLSGHDGEAETILLPDTVFKVTHIEHTAAGLPDRIHMEVVR